MKYKDYRAEVGELIPDGVEYRLPKGRISRRSRIKIRCPLHGVYETSVNTVLSGCKCKKCARKGVASSQRLSREQRIEQCKSVHGERYDYSYLPSNIINNKVKVKIICLEHGEFKQRLNDHLSGKGCLSCSKNSPDKAYILEVSDGEWFRFLKFGVTKNIRRRIAEIQSKTNLTVNLVYLCQFDDPVKCLDAEKAIKINVEDVGVKNLLPEGFTETTSCKNYDYIVKTFKEYGGERL
ncbi:hypothetical protein NVP1072O_01 [Vibrio phage 1.072.O._10N.286.48.A12]|nr:hypothetical protein NVP1056O_01 [Vibrio phage 1.056.O._10N.261.48.C11]AUR84960.1 hypothetical protein NVP1066O_01 [Vibrio phage 1.066.O._10N.286.46.E8]AUR85091.1 hypothetical protein NVP1068O_01 [Vibrio phage 1.068.O._10N.261.51.F8]AUR85318.1 hypothetical protein NVP1072O_01 [Vibrio phage 1.072.O._10N.286.48.A12]